MIKKKYILTVKSNFSHKAFFLTTSHFMDSPFQSVEFIDSTVFFLAIS